MTNKYLLVILIAFVCLGLGGLIGYGLTPQTQSGAGAKPAAGYQNTFQDGWRAAKEKLKSSGFMPAAGSGNTISGTIKGMGTQKIIITVFMVNPLDDESLKQRTVVITNDTQVMVRKMRTTKEIENLQDENKGKIKELQAEIEATKDAAQKAQLQTELMRLQMPGADVFKEEKISAKDLKVGQSVNVEAKDAIGENLEFTAVKITAEGEGPMAGPAPMAPGASAPAPPPSSVPPPGPAVPPVNPPLPPAPGI